MIRTPDELVDLLHAERDEKDQIAARDDLAQLVDHPGWKRFLTWLDRCRKDAFEQLRQIRGPHQQIAESFFRWQAVDAVYENIHDFIKQSISAGEDVLQRQRETTELQFLREQIYGRSTAGADTGTSGSGAPASPATDPATASAADPYSDSNWSGF